MKKKKKNTPKNTRVFTKKELEEIAYHEIGHVIAIAATDCAEQPICVELLPPDSPEKAALVLTIKLKDTTLTRQNLLAQIACWLGGRAAEIIVYGEPKKGSHSDIITAGKLVQIFVKQHGMSDAFPNEFFDDTHAYAEQTKQKMDAQMHGTTRACFDRAKKAIEYNRTLMDELVSHLVTYRTIKKKTLERFLSRVKRVDGPINVLPEES